VADWYLSKKRSGKKTIPWLARLVGLNDETLYQLSSEYMQGTFNREVKNVPGIEYYSYGFYIADPTVFNSSIFYIWMAHRISRRRCDEDNDGMVTLSSARWGEYQGTYEGDHIAQTVPIPYKLRMIWDDVFDRVIELLDRRFRDSY